MASGSRADEMAALFEECDRGHEISSTFLGTRDKQGFAKTLALTGDYDEAFNYATVEPEATVLPHQREMAEKFQQLVSHATSPTEQDRIGYFAGFVGFMVPYCDAFEKAHQLNAVLQRAVTLRAAGNNEAARAEVLQHGVPLWLAMAPLVRQTMVEYQAAIATRNDQGQLASMQNKFVRLALERLRLSIKEFLNELPEEMNAAYAAATSAAERKPCAPLYPYAAVPVEAGRIVANFHRRSRPAKSSSHPIAHATPGNAGVAILSCDARWPLRVCREPWPVHGRRRHHRILRRRR